MSTDSEWDINAVVPAVTPAIKQFVSDALYLRREMDLDVNDVFNAVAFVYDWERQKNNPTPQPFMAMGPFGPFKMSPTNQEGETTEDEDPE